jgi:hypothetical protein
MAIMRITEDGIRPLEETSFTEAGLRERHDLQRLLKQNLAILSPDLLLIAGESCSIKKTQICVCLRRVRPKL